MRRPADDRARRRDRVARPPRVAGEHRARRRRSHADARRRTGLRLSAVRAPARDPQRPHRVLRRRRDRDPSGRGAPRSARPQPGRRARCRAPVGPAHLFASMSGAPEVPIRADLDGAGSRSSTSGLPLDSLVRTSGTPAWMLRPRCTSIAVSAVARVRSRSTSARRWPACAAWTRPSRCCSGSSTARAASTWTCHRALPWWRDPRGALAERLTSRALEFDESNTHVRLISISRCDEGVPAVEWIPRLLDLGVAVSGAVALGRPRRRWP